MSKEADRWIPLESNPEWAYAAGLNKSQAHFEDVYGLDDVLLAMVTPGAKAVCLCFPCTRTIDNKIKEEASEIGRIVDPTVFWMKQTIPNACGTMALIHALSNSDVTLIPESPLAKFIDECKDKTPLERSALLATTPLFASIHSSAATAGQTDASTADMETNLHFTAFVRAPAPSARAHERKNVEWRLIELDGRREGPIDRGKCDDLLKDAARFVNAFYVAHTNSVQLSMVALCPGPDPNSL
ncbi:hypothetical protein BKA82DRAFT_16161 [Pisolithus tinctorius]|uniref:Ubiquitin carboxyl-terminal hydrolase n=1 Tax=Pisolithus tinctorius Marx 270 TaxID=870435 RepID=A0A0C3IYT1_PISTI|nr:hypothetical protein BKA82DRAFT_16161 [Pisolithus tinctorius]KIO01958.1 hypothetical protein M404DRAFT_16161 [Pisolithus tinctorius Marx 270]